MPSAEQAMERIISKIIASQMKKRIETKNALVPMWRIQIKENEKAACEFELYCIELNCIALSDDIIPIYHNDAHPFPIDKVNKTKPNQTKPNQTKQKLD